jgi:hypothetical protein
VDDTERGQGGHEPDARPEAGDGHDEPVNDPLTQSDTAAPKGSWQSTPEQEG